MNEPRDAMREAEEAVRGVNDIAGSLAERVGRRAGVRAVFGDPVECDGVTVIPVARVRWGFGGGGGQGGPADQQGEGSGGGGGVTASPAGYIEIAGGTATYRPIGFPVSPGTIVAGAVALFLAMCGVRALIR